jgi:esterase/lipase
MKITLMQLSIVVLFFYVSIGAYLYLNQSSYIYFPQPYTSDKYTNMQMKNENETINIIILNEGHKNAILYFGGNAESMANSAEYIKGQFPTFTCYLMDYRGYGNSTGKASEEALYSDALKLYDTIKGKHNRISVGGRSLGSGIATYVAANRDVSKLALITPFNSIVAVAQDKYPIYPVSLLLHANKYDSLSRVKKIKAETFIVMAENDKLILKKYTQKLIDDFNGNRLKVATIKGRGHKDVSSDARYYKIMQDFIGDG